jgi:hypothetical protein
MLEASGRFEGAESGKSWWRRNHRPGAPAVSKRELRASTPHHNSNVLNILRVTTLRTIDLGGKKNSGPLFSRFCGKLSVFFQGNFAPKLVQSA